MLMYSQKYINAISVTIIASTESGVTLVLALLLPNSFGQTGNFRPEALAGALCIAAGAGAAAFHLLAFLYAAGVAAICAGVFCGLHLENCREMKILTGICSVPLLLLCAAPSIPGDKR